MPVRLDSRGHNSTSSPPASTSSGAILSEAFSSRHSRIEKRLSPHRGPDDPSSDHPEESRASLVPRVYVVDDDASVRRALGRILRAAGYDVELIGSAAQYLAHKTPARPACLVLDIRMPGMTGFELCRTIAGTPMALPLVFMTGHADAAVREQARAEGAVDILEKPVDNDALLAAIEQALRRSVHG